MFTQALVRALQSPLTYDRPGIARLLAEDRTPASVVFLFGFKEADVGESDPHLLLILRPANSVHHAAQMAFPGGRLEKGEASEQAALRETNEEVGIESSFIEILGALPEVPTLSSSFRVTPFVSRLITPIDRTALQLDSREVERAGWIPWSQFTSQDKRDAYGLPVYELTSPGFAGDRVWGVTAVMIECVKRAMEAVWVAS